MSLTVSRHEDDTWAIVRSRYHSSINPGVSCLNHSQVGSGKLDVQVQMMKCIKSIDANMAMWRLLQNCGQSEVAQAGGEIKLRIPSFCRSNWNAKARGHRVGAGLWPP